MNDVIERGDVFYANLGQGEYGEQGGIRPVVIIQNDIGNKYSPTVIVAAITTKNKNIYIPTHTPIKEGVCADSTILLEQIRTINKSRLSSKIYHLEEKLLRPMNIALMVSLGLI